MPSASTSPLATAASALLTSTAADGLPTTMQPTVTQLLDREMPDGSPSPARAVPTLTPGGSDSPAVPRCEVGPLDGPVGELEVRASSTVLSSSQIAKGMERSTSATSLSIPLAPSPSRTSHSPGLPQP
jgi:hypothetical protein